MARLVPWSPFREMVDMQRQLDRIFDEVTRNLPANEWSEAGNWLALDVHENNDAYIIETDLPGFNPEDIVINLADNTLSISAESKSQENREGQRQLISERRYGSFQRSVRLPNVVDADNVEAHYENGVLHLRIPKSEKAKPRQIEIKNATMLTTEN